MAAAATTTTRRTTMAGMTTISTLHKPIATTTSTSTPQHAVVVVVAFMVTLLVLVTTALSIWRDAAYPQQQQQQMDDEDTNDETSSSSSSSSSAAAWALIIKRSLLDEMENEEGEESSSSSSSSSSDFPREAQVWFTLLVCGVACWDMAVLLLLNAAMWRPRWEARFVRYIQEGSAVLGYCHAVKAIKKTVVCGFVWNDKYRPPPSALSSSPGSPSKSKQYSNYYSNTSTNTSAASEEDDPSSSAIHTSMSSSSSATGSRPKAQNRQMAIVEYQITIRYKFEGVRVEKIMMLNAGQHDSILPTTGNAVNLLVIPGEATSALFTSHVYYEVSPHPYCCSNNNNNEQSQQQEPPPPQQPPLPQPPEQQQQQQQSYSPRHSQEQQQQQQQPCCKRVFGIYGGTPGWIWGSCLLLLGILLPLWPFWRGLGTEKEEDTESSSFSMVNDVNMWTRVGIVLVANVTLVLMVYCHDDFGNRHHGYPNQFRAHLGTAKKKSFQWK
jgi:hypothetical protein